MTQKGALALLCEYGDNSSSEDDVPFGRVSVKRCHKDSDEDEENPHKIFQTSAKLSLPNILVSEKEEKYIDNPALHEGRIRSFPHERGNWASYLYISYNSNDDTQCILQRICGKLSEYNFRPVSDFHISLTKVVVLKHHWIESFLSTIKKSIFHVKAFSVSFYGLNVYCNEEHTRTFIGLDIEIGRDKLLNLVAILDECLRDFNLPIFYEDPSFHMSLVWCTGDAVAVIKNILPELNEEYYQLTNNLNDSMRHFTVDHIHCKIGNKIINVPFT